LLNRREKNRYGNPSQLPTSMQKEYGPFAQHFVTAFAPEIFNTYLAQIKLYVNGEVWMAKKVQYLMFQFFTEWYGLLRYESPEREADH
jgi:hypothetical protein